jgi:hypothetical protein
MSTENVRSNPTEHLAIRDLLDRYTDAINERDWTTLDSLLTEHGVWAHSGNDDVHHVSEGRGTVAAGIRGFVESTHLVIQMNYAKVIHVDGDRRQHDPRSRSSLCCPLARVRCCSGRTTMTSFGSATANGGSRGATSARSISRQQHRLASSSCCKTCSSSFNDAWRSEPGRSGLRAARIQPPTLRRIK